MTYAFSSPWNSDVTSNVIKYTVESMGGKVTVVSQNCLRATWRTQPYHSKRFHTVLPSTFMFYVGDGIVRAVIGTGEYNIIAMRFNLTGLQIIWNAFIESLMSAAPGVDFGIKPGDAELVEAHFVGDGTKQVFVSATRHSPSWGGAAIGGLLFGTVGALIGGSGGTSYTSGSTFTRFSNEVLVKARYSNGLLAEGVILKKNQVYNEIVVNMSRLSNTENIK